MLTTNKVSQMKELITKIKEADTAYFVHDNPIITDKEYDALVDRLQSLEKEIRTLYDKVEDVVEDIETNKTVDIIPGKNIIITDTIHLKDDSSLDKESIIWNWIVMSLLVIFMILFIIFIGFVIYVCTY